MAAVDGSRHPALLERERTGLILIDVQEAFRPVIDRFDEVVANCGLLAEGLGHTVPELTARLPEGARLVEKVRFSAYGVSAFDEAVAEAGAQSWVVAGIEAHVCVNQTVHDLLQYGFQVQVAADAVSSRTPRNRDLGMAKMSAAGAGTTSAEMALFEMLEQAGSDEFKQISRLVR
jgi:nicotinamidase-related amidase